MGLEFKGQIKIYRKFGSCGSIKNSLTTQTVGQFIEGIYSDSIKKDSIPIKAFEMFLYKFLFYKSMIKAEISMIYILREVTILLVFQRINSEVLRRYEKVSLLF